ncbi:MAG TPA: hypothetical protein VMK65_01435, partial [Longimicrobiales bacterium]|nr:hypothetical protein [Longimicrobiales bacterium]
MMAILAQFRGGPPQTAWDMILGGGLSTKIILGVLLLGSLASWIIIFWKAGQFRRIRKEGLRFLSAMERAVRLDEAQKIIARLPESPYTRVFRQGISLFSE